MLPKKEKGPRSLTRIILYTVSAVFGFLATYFVVGICFYIFLIWFVINGDIKPVLNVFCKATKPLYSVLVKTKLTTYTPDEYFLNQSRNE
jgi:uncharacterized protein YggT (Ycf19 family)